ncbi:MAG: NapC/NirT family cytochrome c [Candidatus Eisenbacteria bacterium]|jgi:cytochrome c nitrite reductase small subunit|nr:NapC/NirT family cytochrome c [Candidatus Eisenbacteria bacterium]
MSRSSLPVRFLPAAAIGGVLALALVGAASLGVSWSSSSSFCMSCHEMRVVGEQGWMQSRHYQNDAGVVASCSDCHVPHRLFPKLYVKARDGSKDVFVHFFGESDPSRMNWDELAASARRKVYDESCRSCHQNLTPEGLSIKGIVAHREYLRMKGRQRCLDCHLELFHGGFREYLFGQNHEGGTP